MSCIGHICFSKGNKTEEVFLHVIYRKWDRNPIDYSTVPFIPTVTSKTPWYFAIYIFQMRIIIGHNEELVILIRGRQ